MKSLFKKKFIRVPNLHLGEAFKEVGRNAFVDWLLIVSISLCVTIVVAGAGIFLYWQISTGKFKGSQKANPAAKKVFDEKELALLVERFRAKEDIVKRIGQGYIGPADPSF